jgi:EPS-associated MarR family transcriptional regulator
VPNIKPPFFTLLMNKRDIHLDLLRKLESNPEYTQRELSQEMGVSLGKVNYCIRKLTEKGLVKITNFKQNPKKMGYAYLLTPKGIEEKARLTLSFLKRKVIEFEILKKEINELKLESENLDNER